MSHTRARPGRQRRRQRQMNALEQRTTELFDWELLRDDPTNEPPDENIVLLPESLLAKAIELKIGKCEKDIANLERKLG